MERLRDMLDKVTGNRVEDMKSAFFIGLAFWLSARIVSTSWRCFMNMLEDM